jgi:lysophospholipase L1-like esterase
MLATSGATNVGHIKSLAYYPTRLTVAQIQALTVPASTAPAAGTYRVAAQRNVMQNTTLAIPGTNPKQAFVWPATIGSGDRTKLRVSVGNWSLADATGDTNTGNSIIIESAVLTLTSTGEFTPIFWGGLRSNTLADGLVKLNSDDILPSAFPSLTAGGVMPNLSAFQVKGIVKPSAAGGKIPTGRWGNETGCQCIQFDAAVTTVSTVDAIGNFTLVSGTAFTTSTKGFSFVLEGPFVSGDPTTYVGYGDSIVEAVGAALVAGGTWFNNAATTLGAAYLQSALGGQSQIMFWKSVNINSYVGLGSVLMDNTGTNTQGGVMYYPLPYYNARQAGVRAIVRPSLNVRSTSTDNWATNGNQTASLVYPDSDSIALQALANAGFVDLYYKMNAVRDTGDKWLTNGVAQTYTPDGVHQQAAGNSLMASELVTQLNSLIFY